MMAEKKSGVIYIMINPSFPDLVKIGYTDEIEKRLKELNGSTAVPFEFQVYATYEVPQRCKDHAIHELIDMLNPELRSVQEKANGRIRKREFFAMTAQDAFHLFEIIADISGTSDKLKKHSDTKGGKEEKKMASEIDEKVRGRRENFTFDRCGISKGAVITFSKDDSITCEVISDKQVLYENDVYYLSALAGKLLNRNNVPGPYYFKYKGELLSDLYDKAVEEQKSESR